MRHLVRKPDLAGFLRVHGLSGQDHIEGVHEADETWQSLRPAEAGNDAEPDLGKGECRFLIVADHAV